MDEFQEVTEAEFYEYINAYPRQLVRDVFGAGDPPLVTFNDFALGDWPDSVVASHFMGYGPNDPPYKWEVRAAQIEKEGRVMGELQKLIEAVEAGTFSGDGGGYMPPRLYGHWGVMLAAFNGSLDAALRLHEALLPHSEWTIDDDGNAMVTDGQFGEHETSVPDNPARAWLLAILRALAKREEG